MLNFFQLIVMSEDQILKHIHLINNLKFYLELRQFSNYFLEKTLHLYNPYDCLNNQKKLSVYFIYKCLLMTRKISYNDAFNYLIQTYNMTPYQIYFEISKLDVSKVNISPDYISENERLALAQKKSKKLSRG